jgi:5-oxoprolinase (ATP-hydrolysing)
VCGGNVLTSQRIVDVVLKALNACAASLSMDQLSSRFVETNRLFFLPAFRMGILRSIILPDVPQHHPYADSLQTIAGGSGAGPHWHGTSGVHTHITNTRIGDVEILERRYPVLLHQFGLREGSTGGEGGMAGRESSGT